MGSGGASADVEGACAELVARAAAGGPRAADVEAFLAGCPPAAALDALAEAGRAGDGALQLVICRAMDKVVATEAGDEALRADRASAEAILAGARAALAPDTGEVAEPARRLALKAVRAHFSRGGDLREGDADGIAPLLCALLENGDAEDAALAERALAAMASTGDSALAQSLLADTSPLAALVASSGGANARVRAMSAAVACGGGSPEGAAALAASPLLAAICASAGDTDDILERLNGVELLAQIADGGAAEACGSVVASTLVPIVESQASSDAPDPSLCPIIAAAACRAAKAATAADAERLVRATATLARRAAEMGDPGLEAAARDALSYAPAEVVFAIDGVARGLCGAALGAGARRPLPDIRAAAAHTLATLAGADSLAMDVALSATAEECLKAAVEGALSELASPGLGGALWWLIERAPSGADGTAQRVGVYRIVRALALRQWGARGCFASAELLAALATRERDAAGRAAEERQRAANALRHAAEAAGATAQALAALGPPSGADDRPVAIPDVATVTR